LGVLGRNGDSSPNLTPVPTPVPTIDVTFCVDGSEDLSNEFTALRNIVSGGSELALAVIDTPFSAQREALCWLAYNDGNEIAAVPDANPAALIHRYTLAVFYFSLIAETGSLLDLPGEWLTPESECQWRGISCNEERFTMQLDVPGRSLNGTIPHELENLSPSLGKSMVHPKLIRRYLCNESHLCA
jgi:hypothetical protein